MFDGASDVVEGGVEVAERASGRVGADGREADRQLRRIARRRAGLEADEARWLLVARRAAVHLAFGYATFAEYVERVLGHGPRACADRLRVADALTELPTTAAALAAGAVSYSTVRELTRVATTNTEAAWLDAAGGKTAREVEAMVTGRRRGDRPDDPTEPDLRPRILRFEVTPETYALVRDAERRLAADAGHPLSDDELVAAMARAVLVPTVTSEIDADTHVGHGNRPGYQIALTVCTDCDRAWQDGAGQSIEVGAAALATARCDAQVIGRVDVAASDADARPATRATRTIPPAIRRRVLRRDHGRCVVPGCRATRWIDVHHLHPRALGGGHDPQNLVSACAGHHRAAHAGRLVITGTPGDLQFHHADGRPWGSPPAGPLTRPPLDAAARDHRRRPAPSPAPPTDEPSRSIHSALRNLGFSPSEARAATAHAMAHVGTAAPIERLVAAALRACRLSTTAARP